MANLELFADKAVERLEKVKQLLLDIKEIDSKFKLSNVIEVDSNTTLVFTTNNMLKIQCIEEYERKLTNKLQCKCIILPYGFNLEKSIQEVNKKIDYETVTFYADGEVIREETKQYK